MAFDFLPDQAPPPPKPSTDEASGGKFQIGENVFYDDYKHHLDAHALFSTPPKEDEFNLEHNLELAKEIFAEGRIKFMIKDGFYGADTDYDSLVEGYTNFQNPELLSKTIKSVDAEIPDDMFSEIEKPKMKINDRFGMFSFDLAAMAMTYVYDYYNENGEKVDSNFVEKRKSEFFFTPTGEKVAQKIRRRKDGTPVVISSVRKSLIDFEKQAKKDRYVEIMVFNSFAFAERASSLIYNAMAALSVAKNLILKGFRVKLTSVIVTKGGRDQKNRTYFHFVPAKRFNQPLDINAVAYVCGDPRFFRFQGFKMIVKGFDRDNVKVPGGLGTIISDISFLSDVIEKDYVPNSQLKQGDTRLYFGGSRTVSDVQKEIKQAVKILKTKYAENEKS